MTSASLDRLLAGLVVLMASTGLLSLRAGRPEDAWLFVAHGIGAGVLTVAVALKIRRSVPRAVGGRRWWRLGLGVAISLGVIAALAAGYLWVALGEIVWVDVAGLVRWTLLTVHAWIGLILVPLVVIHLLPRRWRLLRPAAGTLDRARSRLLTRRSLLVGGGLLGAAIALRGVAAAVEIVRGGQRRFTGSRWLPAGGVPPATTFFGEPAPSIDQASWRLRVGDRSLALGDLRMIGETSMTTVLDCTSGWALETDWQGVPLATVLEAAGIDPDTDVIVRSVTGWGAQVAPDEVDGCLLAWGCAGADLPAANGAPLRLVAPGRRGLDWVKWVASIEPVGRT
jgi:DMSO/TMAO reductase YedYZ molybdopterin-dependent catalytic subunit